MMPVIVAVVLVVISDRPGGRSAGGTLKMKDPLPPLAVMVWLYAVPATPAGRLGLVGVNVIGP